MKENNMYPERMPFCLLLKFVDGLKAKFQVHFGTIAGFEFQSVEGSIVGAIRCMQDGMPMEKHVHESLKHLTPDQLRLAERIVCNGIPSALSRILCMHGHPTVWFSHTLPCCVNVLAQTHVAPFVFLHNSDPGPLSIRD